MSTDYRALCAELLSLLDNLAMRNPEMDGGLLRRRARAALAQPKPVALTRPECFNFAMSFLGDPEETDVRRYVEALEARPAIQPVAVSERLPGAEDCDSEGRCWVGYAVSKDALEAGYNPSWELCKFHPPDEVWLPHWTLPVPAPDNNTKEKSQ